MFALKCNCEACTNNYPSHYQGIAEGKLPAKYDILLNMHYVMLDIEIKNLEKILNILYEFNYMLPCRSLNELQLRLHKIMKLKYGDISTSLRVTFSK